jgi:hypothetical protein
MRDLSGITVHHTHGSRDSGAQCTVFHGPADARSTGPALRIVAGSG